METENAPFRLASLGTSPASGGGKRSEHGAILSSPVYGGGGSQARSDCETEGGLPHRIVAIARGWIGTPYVHQASLKGVGCDCVGLLRGVWRELYGEEPEETPPYSPDWAEATGAETLYMALRRHAVEIGATQIAPGDIALFRLSPRGPAKHCGVIAAREFTSPYAGRSEHFERRREMLRVGGAASENAPHPEFARDAHEFRPPRVGGGECLSLIHARQNKRVSEEPLSPFWRSKLAYAFRV